MSESPRGLNYNEMKAELQALRKKLEDLETNQAALQVGAHPAARRRFPRRLITASISLAPLLMVAGGLLWGQQSGALQALFVNNKGDVGIGTNDPKHKLEVNGDALFRGPIGSYLGAALFGNVGIGMERHKDWPLAIVGEWDYSNLLLFMDSKKKEKYAINLDGGGFNLWEKDPDSSRLSIEALTGRVGIGNNHPQAMLDVNGDALIQGNATITGSINGEKPRFKLTIPAGGTTWNTAVVDLKDLCGDDDGCHIKLLMQHKNFENNPPVRLITADLYMVQRTPNGPIKGYTRSSGANNHEASWTLNNGSAATLLNTWSDWFSISNTYYPGDWFCGGKVAKSSSEPATCALNQPYSSGQNNWRNGVDAYLVGFRFSKDVTATIFIYDR